jgi:hypothetical protein
MESMFGNSSLVPFVVQESNSTQNTILGSVGVGTGSLALLLMGYKFVWSQFQEGPDGKRPSVSQVLCRLLRRTNSSSPITIRTVGEGVFEPVTKVSESASS